MAKKKPTTGLQWIGRDPAHGVNKYIRYGGVVTRPITS